MLNTIEQRRRSIEQRQQAVALQIEQRSRFIEQRQQAVAFQVEQRSRSIEQRQQAVALQIEQRSRLIQQRKQTVALRIEQPKLIVNLTPQVYRCPPQMAENFNSTKMLTQYSEQVSSLQRAMEEAIREITRTVVSSEVQSSAHAFGSTPLSDKGPVTTLPRNLGDWRAATTRPQNLFTDWTARSGCYGSLEFNKALTNDPPPALERSLHIAGLTRQPPLVEWYGPPVPCSADDTEEANLVRTNVAHDWLLRLETQLRRFIDRHMMRVFGCDWPKRRLPNGMYDQWKKKSDADCRKDQERPLIAYADFTDYESVICKSDNWKEVFAPYFGRKESVRESFQRLYPIRIDTMHARPITQDDGLLLYVEAKRLVRVAVLVPQSNQ